jgi:hypothetical protein
LLSQAQSGASVERNRSIKEASGDLIAFLDVDDLWPEGNLPFLVDRLPGAARGSSPAWIHSAHGAGRPERPARLYRQFGGGLPRLYRCRPLSGKVFGVVGLFDEAMHFSEDKDWYNRARERGLVMGRLERLTLLVHCHGANMT